MSSGRAVIAILAIVAWTGAAGPTTAAPSLAPRVYDFTLEVQVHSASNGGAAEASDALALNGTETITVRSSGVATLDVVAQGTRNGVATREHRTFSVRVLPNGEIRPTGRLTGAILPIINLQNEAAREFSGRQLQTGRVWSERADDAGMPVLRAYRVSGVGAFAARRVMSIESAGSGQVVDPKTGAPTRSLSTGATFYYDAVRHELVGASGRSFSASSGGAANAHVNITVLANLRLRPMPHVAPSASPARSPSPVATAQPSPAASGTPAAPSTLPPGLGSTPAPIPSTLRSTAAPPAGATPAPIGPSVTPPPTRSH